MEEHQDCEEDDSWYMSMASPRPPDPSLFISEDWRNKNADEIYRALVNHPCNPRLENDTLTVKATKKRSALSCAYAEATKITLALKVYQKIGLKNYQLNYSNIRPDIRKYIFSGKKIAERELDSENIEVEIILTDYYKTISEIIANGLKKTE